MTEQLRAFLFSLFTLAAFAAVALTGCGAGAPEEAVEPSSADAPASDAAASAGWIVFSSGRSGDGDIYAVDPASGETILVSGTDAPEGTVRSDPARGRVVYHRYESDPERAVLVARAADGRTEDLFVDPNGDVASSWSPHGDWIVYAAVREGQEDLYLAAPDGSGERRLTDDPEVDRYPAFSADGGQIVFARRLESGWELFTFDLDQVDLAAEGPVDPAALVRRTENGVYVGHPSWSPDGRFVAFDTLIDGQAEIAMLELATGTITRLTERAGNDLVPAWSLDGRSIAFGGEPAVDDGGAGNWDLWLVDVESKQIERLTTQPTFDGAPVFVSASTLGR